jgi:sialate O-acetylesterase
MIRSWREDFRQGDFPFYYVQIAPYDYGTPYIATLLREAQLLTLCYARNTGMAVTLDIGNPGNVHPVNKQDVGKRLALIALAGTYHFPDLEFSGPVLKKAEVMDIKYNPPINGIRLYFNHASDGLVVKQTDVNNFIISGTDRKFLPAEFRIEGETLLLWNNKITEPVAVRYAFLDTAFASLFNKRGLPASSFRTDDWPVLYDLKE